MASIAKLAVILSAVTKPLEAGLKGAEKSVSSFSHSFKEAGKLFTGLFVMDSIEKGFKKALKANEELNESAEKLEGSFGRVLLNITLTDKWLPKMAHEVESFADRVDEGFAWEDIKEGAVWLFEFSKRFNSENANARANAMREEFVKNKLIEKALERQKKLERERFEAAREAQWVAMAGTEEQAELLKELENKNNALLTDAEKLARVRGDAPDSAKMMLVDYEMRKNVELEKRKKNEEDLKKIMEDGKSLTESMLNPLEKLALEQAKYNEMLNKGAINTDTYNRAIKALTPGLKELESIQKEIYALEKGELAAKLKELADAGATKDVQDQYKKAYGRLQDLKAMEELKKEMEKEFDGFGGSDDERSEPRFGGGAAAGSAAAYSAIISASAAQREDDNRNGLLATSKKQLELDVKQFRMLGEIHKQQGDAIKAAGPGIRLVRLQMGGGN